jgi:uncharacterized membrane protein YphA (DoxX/SURF4 family)
MPITGNFSISGWPGDKSATRIPYPCIRVILHSRMPWPIQFSVMDYYRNPHAPTTRSILRDTSLTILRIGAGLLVGLMHGKNLILGAYGVIWSKQPWVVSDFLGERGIGGGVIIGSVVAVLVALCAPALVLGLLTRFSSLLLAICAGAGAAVAFRTALLEPLLLYCLIFSVLSVAGPGYFAVDGLLGGKKRSPLAA